MTRLFVLGSGSKGNAFAIESAEGVVLVDVGFGAKALSRRAERAGVSLERVSAIVLTHEHGDHTQGAVALADSTGAPILCSRGTWRGLGEPPEVAHHALRPAHPLTLGALTVHSCLTTHDANEPLAVAIEIAGSRLAFATDIGRATAGVRYLLRGANAVVIESNYDEVMLRTGRYPPSVQQRIAGSSGHLSNRAAADLVADVVHDELAAVVLAHLSQQCNTHQRARETVEPILRARGFRGMLHVAAQDEPLGPISVRAAPYRDQAELALHWDAALPAPPGSGSPDR